MHNKLEVRGHRCGLPSLRERAAVGVSVAQQVRLPPEDLEVGVRACAAAIPFFGGRSHKVGMMFCVH